MKLEVTLLVTLLFMSIVTEAYRLAEEIHDADDSPQFHRAKRSRSGSNSGSSKSSRSGSSKSSRSGSSKSSRSGSKSSRTGKSSSGGTGTGKDTTTTTTTTTTTPPPTTTTTPPPTTTTTPPPTTTIATTTTTPPTTTTVSTTTETAAADCSEVGETAHGDLYPVGPGCYSTYCWNVHGVGREMQCAPGTVYNDARKVCDWYNEVDDCKKAEYMDCTDPSGGPLGGVQFTKSEDCADGTFYMCNAGTADKKLCEDAPGRTTAYVFNPKTRMCETHDDGDVCKTFSTDSSASNLAKK